MFLQHTPLPGPFLLLYSLGADMALMDLGKAEQHCTLYTGVQKSNILNIRDIRQLSLRLDNLRLKERQNAGPKAQPAK